MNYRITVMQAITTTLRLTREGDNFFIALFECFRMREFMNAALDAGLTPEDVQNMLDNEFRC